MEPAERALKEAERALKEAEVQIQVSVAVARSLCIL